MRLLRPKRRKILTHCSECVNLRNPARICRRCGCMMKPPEFELTEFQQKLVDAAKAEKEKKPNPIKHIEEEDLLAA